MLPFREIFLDFILPAVVAGVGFLAGWWPLRRRRDGRWAGAVGVTLGAALAECALLGTPRWPPGTGDASFWLVWFLVPLGAAAVLDALLRPPLWLRAVVLLLLARIGVRLLVAPLVRGSGTQALQTLWDMELWIDAAGGVAVLWWLAWEALAEHTRRFVTPAALVIVLGGTAAVLGVTSNVKPSMVAVALAGMAAAALVLAWPFKDLSLGRGAVLVLATPVPAMFVFAHYYSYTEPPMTAVALLLAAPLLAWAGDLPGVRAWGRWRVAARLVPVVLAVAAAVGLSARQSMESKQGSGQSAGEPGEY